MVLYEFEGKNLFSKYGIKVPRGVVVRREDDLREAYRRLEVKEVVVKVQVLAGKRGKRSGIRFCSSSEEVATLCADFFSNGFQGQYVPAILLEERLDVFEEHYLSLTYSTERKQPFLLYSLEGGVEVENVSEGKVKKYELDLRSTDVNLPIPYAQEVWRCFLEEDARLLEINPLAKTNKGRWVALDAKVILDDDAFYRHEGWVNYEPRTILGRFPTEREVAAKKIDEGEGYYRGTAGKYIELSGDIAVLFSGGGASLANMDALIKTGCRPANYTEYSGNPPPEKVYALTKIVLSKPGLRGFWIAGGVANFTSVAETFYGIAQALDEIKPRYPIVVRRAGPFEAEGMKLMEECAKRNNLNIKLFGKEVSMGETAQILAELVEAKQRE